MKGLSLLEQNSKCHINWFSYRKPTKSLSGVFDDEHEDFKYEVYKELRKRDIDVITEAVFKRGGRADLFLPQHSLAIEILSSEKDENIDIKATRYPCEIVSIRANLVSGVNGYIIETPQSRIKKFLDNLGLE